jgi:L-alanine-DL-glutamate epimerase-like enolase superfamily enzyme
MPRVTELRLFAVDLPFKVAFRHAAAARTTSESLFLQMSLDSGAEGWGEALPRAYVSGERRQDAFALLRDQVLPALVGRRFASLSEVVSLTPGVRYAEGCFGRHLLREDPAAPLVQFGYGGRPPRRPAGPGLGVQVDPAMLERWAVDQAVVA